MNYPVINSKGTGVEQKSCVEIIGADRARFYLSLNTHNRPIVKANLEKLTNEMQRGCFKFNGESIKISKTNVILDGQHRLLAVIASGATIQTVVISGLDDSVFDTIDQGATRTLGHLMGINGVKNYNICSSCVPILLENDNGRAGQKTNYRKVSKSELLAYFIKNRNLIESAGSYASTRKNLRRWLSPSYLCFLHVIFSRIDEELCETFLDKIETGIDITQNSIEFVLREKLINISLSAKKESARFRSAYVIFAWNYMREGRTAKQIRWRTVGDAVQEYPRPR